MRNKTYYFIILNAEMYIVYACKKPTYSPGVNKTDPLAKNCIWVQKSKSLQDNCKTILI